MSAPSTHPICIVGGGAAGYFAAIACAENAPRRKVVLLEATRKPLAKVRISGGGRCNVTHACFEPAQLVRAYPRGTKELRGPFSKFQPQDTVAWFEARGVQLKTEEDGRMFPVTDDAETVASCLESEAAKAGVEIRLGAPVGAIRKTPGGFEVTVAGAAAELFASVLLATGGSPKGFDLARDLGHAIVPPVPSLFTFKLEDPRLEGLSGVSLPPARLKLEAAGKKFEETGPVLITHWGLSGPAVLKLSSWAARELHEINYCAPLMVNWLGSVTASDALARLLAHKEKAQRRQLGTGGPWPLPRRFWERLLAHAQIPGELLWAETSKKALRALSEELTQGRFEILGKGEFKDEFVTCGGVALKEVSFQTMESRLVPGLYFAGEILDVDALTGGYNFQAAWTTGWIAGKSMAG